MSFLPQRVVIKNIKERQRTVKGKRYAIFDAYLGVDPLSRKPVRMAMTDRDALETAVKARYKAVQGVRGSETMLTPAQMKDAAQALLTLADANMEISLTECARLATASPLLSGRTGDRLEEKTLGEAYSQYLAEFDGVPNRKDVESRVGRWMNSVGAEKPVSQVTEEDVTGFCGQYSNRTTYNGHFTYIRSFLTWCTKKRHRYIAENPLDEIKVVAPKYKRPKYIPSEDAERVFRRLEADAENRDSLAYAIVAFFCGVRSEEIVRGANSEEAATIDIPNRTITIVAVKGHTKGICPRSFTIPDNALAWMKSFDFMSAWRQIVPQTKKRLLRIVRATLGKYEKNSIRHSFVTHHYAAYESLDRTCKIAGTSAQMVKDHYSGLGNQPDGLKYFSIMPKKGE